MWHRSMQCSVFGIIPTPGISVCYVSACEYLVYARLRFLCYYFGADAGGDDLAAKILAALFLAEQFYGVLEQLRRKLLDNGGGISSCNDKIEAITSMPPTLFRCPYGEYDDHVISAVNSMGMTAIQWDVGAVELEGRQHMPEISERVLKRVQPGGIVLFHNAAKHTPEALPGIIESLSRRAATR